MTEYEVTSDHPAPANYSEAVHLAYYIPNSFSLIGQLFIIITYMSIRKKSNNFYSYVVHHCFISFPWLITNYFIVPLGDKASSDCTAAAFINTCSYGASMIWSTVIAWTVYSGLKNKKRIGDVPWYLPFAVYLISLCLCLYALMTDSYGPFVGIGIDYCWFDRNLGGAVSYWAPFIITSILDLVLYVRSIFIVRSHATAETSQAFLSLLIFPLIQIFCNSGGIVSKVAEYLGDVESTELEVLHFVCAKGQGLYEALAYGANQTVRTEIYRVWCKRRKKTSDDLQTPMTSINDSSGSIDLASIEKERNQRSIMIEL